jgi:hypothetical protein
MRIEFHWLILEGVNSVSQTQQIRYKIIYSTLESDLLLFYEIMESSFIVSPKVIQIC